MALGFALVIYVMAFAKVWRNRHELTGIFNPFNENPFEGIITKEIDVTTHARQHSSTGAAPPEDEESGTLGVKTDDFNPYSVNIEADPTQRKPSAAEMFQVRSLTRNHALSETNPEAWLYARVAFLFFCSLLICWVPSSINRLYSIAHPDHLVFWLNYIETLVLPLQGFFNAIVYIVTSQTACHNLWRSMTGAQQLPRKNSTGTGMDGVLPSRKAGTKLERMGMGRADSKLELFTSRRTSERLGAEDTSVTSLRGH